MNAEVEDNRRTLASDMRRAWLVELRRLLFAVGGGWLVGFLFSAPHLGMAAGLLLLVSFHLRLLYLLARWSLNPHRVELPESGGVWGEIFEGLYATQRRARQRKRKLASILAEFQASTAALPDGAIVVTPRGHIAWFNTAAQGLLGLRSPQDIGARINNLIRHPGFQRYVEQADFSKDVQLPSPLNAQYTLNLRLIPYGNGQRLLIVRDVSEHQRLDRMRRDFVANASHELRTPLTVLSGYIEMMHGEAGRPDSALAAWSAPLGEMRGQLGRMEHLIGDLLKLARLESDTPAPRNEVIDMEKLLLDAVRQAQTLSRGAHHFDSAIDETLLLYGRESELQSIAINLLSNAVRYSPDGGSIRLEWRTAREGGSEYPLLRVEDSGIGIEAESIPRLTERFFRVDVGRSRATGGTGLGLAIVKHALEHHEAELSVTSEPGEGSAFSCHFPSYRLYREGEQRRVG
ncbi:phosphate regulon sensor histidine kinase PhoR [Algiphilus sp.]|uniref:phosphate regulon sensor histidine kinase PhoR n=1 Tax=Algiphilus sp. TaxID=1872431 RepID=UPI002A6087CA|nr:phosphate regulon sensor histidine kinase PhoR [Pseudomonadota bacterium]